MDVLLDTTYNPQNFDARRVYELALFAGMQLGLPDNAEVSVTFAKNDEIARLNEQYRGKIGPTDVLSFECDNLDDNFDNLCVGDTAQTKTHAACKPNDGEGEGFVLGVADADLGIALGAPCPVYSLGDIIIAPDVVAAQAAGYGNTPADELDLMVVHGMLHLCGYDHIDDADAEEMETLQQEILNGWHNANPIQNDDGATPNPNRSGDEYFSRSENYTSPSNKSNQAIELPPSAAPDQKAQK